MGQLKFPVKARIRVRRDEKPGDMNKTEAAYARQLDMEKAAGTILEWWFDSWKWKLKAKATWFTPDFVVMRPDGALEVHEVKGFMEEDAWLKLKFFAALYPLPLFIVKKAKGKGNAGLWDITRMDDAEVEPTPPTSSAEPRTSEAPHRLWPR